MVCRYALLLPLCAAFAQTPPPAAKPDPDVLTFANGEKLVGHLVRATGAAVTFKSDSIGEVTVPWAKIQELHANENFVALNKNIKLNRKSDLSKIPQGKVEMTGQKITVTPATGAPETVPVAETAHLIEQPAFDRVVLHNPGFFEAWKGAVTGGAALVYATQDSRTFTGGVSLVRAIPTENWLDSRNRTLFDFAISDGVITQPNTPKIKTDIVHADLERDEYLPDTNVFGFGRAALDHNFSQGLSLQQSYAGGLGWTVVKHANTTLDFKGSASYIRQQFADKAKDQNLIGSVFAENYLHKFGKGITFLEGIAVTPAWNNTHAYAAAANASLTVPVYKQLGFSIATIDSFLNDPPPGFKKNSFQLTTGLTYTLK